MVVQKENLKQATLPFFLEDADAMESLPEKDTAVDKVTRTSKKDTTSTFADNLSLPIHRWFRYSAGFSANWVHQLIQQEKSKDRSKVLDPFSGSGTVLLESELCDIESIGIEAHPFIARVANAKLQWQQDPKSFSSYALSILKKAETSGIELQDPPELIKKCFSPETLIRLETLRITWEASADNSPLSELTWLALASILRSCSPVGTAQWQYILPGKTKSKILDPYEAFRAKIQLMIEDMARYQNQAKERKSAIYWGDARECSQVADGWADLVITSPPYANNYDYADATRLEMSFFRDIQGWGNLQNAVRRHLVRSCTQHVGSLSKETYHMIANPLLSSIQEELIEVCKQLEAEKENHGGKKQYHTMIATYFSDMANVWIALRRITHEGSLLCFVIGDSAPYGIYVPVDRWLGELAIAAGFKSYVFEKTRDRNVKWKNRKHTVPLHEGRLWIEG
jgi:DNA modification methylase